jgi:hypothetical protein
VQHCTLGTALVCECPLKFDVNRIGSMHLKSRQHASMEAFVPSAVYMKHLQRVQVMVSWLGEPSDQQDGSLETMPAVLFEGLVLLVKHALHGLNISRSIVQQQAN